MLCVMTFSLIHCWTQLCGFQREDSSVAGCDPIDDVWQGGRRRIIAHQAGTQDDSRLGSSSLVSIRMY